jgi:glutamate synthase (NADPH/NADH) large chain
VNPDLAMESVEDLASHGLVGDVTPEKAVRNLIKALGKGVLKVMSKMGISTVASYHGAQVFEAVGLDQAMVDRYFTGTPSKLGGVGLDVLAEEVSRRHAHAYPLSGAQQTHRTLEVGGEYQWRREGELHLFNPETVFRLQHATRARRYDVFKQYTAAVDSQSERMMTLRSLFRFKDDHRPPVPLDEVEPVEDIVRRFSTGAMSYGSISQEAHETLAVAMNRLGGKSNTGEGGEDSERLYDDRRSAVKQVASGRFGVTSEYLVNADDVQIKMAQGAKPGEGGQLPGNRSTPGSRGPGTPRRASASSRRRRTTTSTRSRTSPSSSTTSRTPTTGRGCTSSWCPRWASARSRQVSARRMQTSYSSPVMTEAPAPRR